LTVGSTEEASHGRQLRSGGAAGAGRDEEEAEEWIHFMMRCGRRGSVGDSHKGPLKSGGTQFFAK
jgi:hypothetical protein